MKREIISIAKNVISFLNQEIDTYFTNYPINKSDFRSYPDELKQVPFQLIKNAYNDEKQFVTFNTVALYKLIKLLFRQEKINEIFDILKNDSLRIDNLKKENIQSSPPTSC